MGLPDRSLHPTGAALRPVNTAARSQNHAISIGLHKQCQKFFKRLKSNNQMVSRIHSEESRGDHDDTQEGIFFAP